MHSRQGFSSVAMHVHLGSIDIAIRIGSVHVALVNFEADAGYFVSSINLRPDSRLRNVLKGTRAWQRATLDRRREQLTNSRCNAGSGHLKGVLVSCVRGQLVEHAGDLLIVACLQGVFEVNARQLSDTSARDLSLLALSSQHVGR